MRRALRASVHHVAETATLPLRACPAGQRAATARRTRSDTPRLRVLLARLRRSRHRESQVGGGKLVCVGPGLLSPHTGVRLSQVDVLATAWRLSFARRVPREMN